MCGSRVIRSNVRLALLVTLLLLLALACSHETISAEQQAANTAKRYYDCLLAGDYEGFLNGKADADSLPADYRAELLSAYQHYIRKQQDMHKGITSVAISNARSDSTLRLTYTFLILSFGDSTKEEITVPMVRRGDEWKMR